MIRLDLRSSMPLNDQIQAALKGLVARGLLKAGDQAPSIRALAARLKVNPNTVARAFRELALEGFIEPRRGAGNYISEAAKRLVRDGLGQTRRRLKEALRLARGGGLAWEDIQGLVREAQGEEK